MNIKTTLAAAIIAIAIAYAMDATTANHGPVIVTGQTALPIGLPPSIGS